MVNGFIRKTVAGSIVPGMVALVAMFSSLPGELRACSLCPGEVLRRSTLREDAKLSSMVFFGSLSNARLDPRNPENGLTDFTVKEIIKDDKIRQGRTVFTLPRYIPLDQKVPTFGVIFCDVNEGKWNFFRGVPTRSNAVVGYFREAIKLPENDRNAQLLFYFNNLEAEDSVVSGDAFLEIAKASDQELAKFAPNLDPGRLRKLIANQQTSPERLGLFAFLLGFCGGKADAELLLGILSRGEERYSAAISGATAGYILLNPAEGWTVAGRLMTDAKRTYGDRISVINTFRFFKVWNEEATKKQILAGYKTLIEQGDLAELAVEDLRRWQWWDLSGTIFSLYGKPAHSSPIVRRNFVYYALSCPKPEATTFINELRKKDPTLVSDVEEALDIERKSKNVVPVKQ